MAMRRAAVSIALCMSAAGPSTASPTAYRGMCEASAGVFLDASRFAVASDESNVLRVYDVADARAPVGRIDLEPFTGFDKSDLEGAARIDDRIYWISSHSFNKEGEDKKKRKILFATDVVSGGGAPVLKTAGAPAQTLRDALALAVGVAPEALDVEGLAPAPTGGLMIGLRGPLKGGNALVVELLNPRDVVERLAAPRFGPTKSLELSGRGVRSLERLNSGYLVAAGPVKDADAAGFALFHWDGEAKVTPLNVELHGLKPEAALLAPDGESILLLSDDEGSGCEDDQPSHAKGEFRALTLPTPPRDP